jgi:hypothetical protein
MTREAELQAENARLREQLVALRQQIAAAADDRLIRDELRAELQRRLALVEQANRDATTNETQRCADLLRQMAERNPAADVLLGAATVIEHSSAAWQRARDANVQEGR